MIEILTSQVVSGLATGCVYALIALGFVLIFKATDVVNFAQGEFVMVSGFISYTLLIGLGCPTGWSWSSPSSLSGFMGVVLERVVVRPIMDAPIFSIVIATIGASTVLRSSAGILYGYDVLPLPTIFSKDPVRLGILSFTAMDVGVIGCSLVDHAGPLSVLQTHQDRHGHAGHRPEPDGGPAHGRERQAHLLAHVGDQRGHRRHRRRADRADHLSRSQPRLHRRQSLRRRRSWADSAASPAPSSAACC